MILLYTSLVFSLITGLGRQTVVFGRIKKGLWLFSHWYWIRNILTLTSLALAVTGYIYSPSNSVWWLLLSILFLNGFAYFFDMPFFFPEIKQVQRIPHSEADIRGATEVIGVTVGYNTSVAYPINEIVMPRHLVHDTVAGTPLLVTYCALCRSALVFKAEIDNQPLCFKVAAVWRRNMIIIDNQTKSIWQQTTGECIYGKYKGQRLELVSGESTIWDNWQKKHPYSEYAYEFVEARRGLMSRTTMLALLHIVTSRVSVPGITDLSGLPKRETVFGIAIDGISKAYPISELHLGIQFLDRVANVELLLEYDGDGRYLSAVRNDTGEPIIVEKHWWLGWKEFHPDTEIWQHITNEHVQDTSSVLHV